MPAEAQCDNCGELNPIDSAFCLNCGKYLGWHEKPPVTGTGPTSGTPTISGPTGPPTGPTGQTTTGAPAGSGGTGQAATGGSSALPRRGADPRSGAGASSTAQMRPVGAGGCPNCGQPIEPGRRFCSRCGFLLVPSGPTTAGPSQSTIQGGSSGWWFWGDPAERAARREYRRSLPPFYRWRRVILSVLALVVAVVLVVFLFNDPVEWVKQRWYDVTGRTTELSDVTPTAVGTTAPQYDVSGLMDGDPRTAWGTPWPAEAPVSGSCEGRPGEGRIHLTWSRPSRIRAVSVRAGLDAAESGRDSQPIPRTLDVSFPNGRCVHVPLDNNPDAQTVEVDSTTPVRSMDVAVGSVFASTATRSDQVVTLSELQLLIRPR